MWVCDIHAAGSHVVERVGGFCRTKNFGNMHVATNKDYAIYFVTRDEFEKPRPFFGVSPPHLPAVLHRIDFDHLNT